MHPYSYVRGMNWKTEENYNAAKRKAKALGVSVSEFLRRACKAYRVPKKR